MSSSSLDSFLTSPNPLPSALATSSPITDRSSTFLSTLYRLSSPSASLAHRIHAHHKHVLHAFNPASHEIAAWRCMVLKKGKDGLGGPEDFELVEGWEDDGEDGGGRCVLRTMQREGVIDAVVVVSRWFGGTLLGPIRFAHIERCTRDVCRACLTIEQIEAIIEELKELDEQLVQLRAELAKRQGQTSDSVASESKSDARDAGEVSVSNSDGTKSTRAAQGYTAMLLSPTPDVTRAKRLLVARQNAIRSVKGILERTATSSADQDAGIGPALT